VLLEILPGVERLPTRGFSPTTTRVSSFATVACSINALPFLLRFFSGFEQAPCREWKKEKPLTKQGKFLLLDVFPWKMVDTFCQFFIVWRQIFAS